MPIWVYFMREALRAVPERSRPLAPGLVQARISPSTGELASADESDAIFETFLEGHLPGGGNGNGGTSGVGAPPASAPTRPRTDTPATKDEPLF